MEVGIKCPDCLVDIEHKTKNDYNIYQGPHVKKWFECPECKVHFRIDITIQKLITNYTIKSSIGEMT